MGVPSRARLGVSARARFTTVSAADLGTSARCSRSRATERYPNNSITPRDSISASREPISASADRTTVSSAEIRSAKATASACHTASLSIQQDYRRSNTCHHSNGCEQDRGRDTVAWGIGAPAPSDKQGQEAPISHAPAKPHLENLTTSTPPKARYLARPKRPAGRRPRRHP